MLGLAAAAGRVRGSRAAIFGASAVCAAMFAWRWTMFHGPGGYIDASTGHAQVLSIHLGSALKALLPARLGLDVVSRELEWVRAQRGAGGRDCTRCCCADLRRTPPRRVSVALLATTVGALLPAYHLALIGQDLNGPPHPLPPCRRVLRVMRPSRQWNTDRRRGINPGQRRDVTREFERMARERRPGGSNRLRRQFAASGA